MWLLLYHQGIAHAVDRVMFPLPVGDLVQTLQADRDRRFTTFLKAIQASGFEDTLTGQCNILLLYDYFLPFAIHILLYIVNRIAL